MPLTADQQARYQRHVALAEIGIEGQQKLCSARVLVVGVGGLGCPAALYLAATGIGTLGLVDHDRVELSNLQRQVLFQSTDIGRLKVEAARERLQSMNPDVQVIAHAVELRAANVRGIFASYDLVLDGTDRLTTRYLINDACVLMSKPLVTAAIHRFDGQAMTYVPGRGPCYRCLFEDATEGIVPNCAEAGVLGVLPGLLGVLQATEAIKLILDIGVTLQGRLLTYDAGEMRFQELSFEPRVDCAVCGEHPSIVELQDAPAACGIGDVRRLSPEQLRALLLSEPAQARPLLVDVREPREFMAGHLPGAINIPLGELEARLGEIPGDRQPVFMCRSGSRSLAACGIASRSQLAAPTHLEGGLLAWAASIDPGIRIATAG